MLFTILRSFLQIFGLGRGVKFKGDSHEFKTTTMVDTDFVCLFDLILYVPSTIFQNLIGTGLPGLNQY